MGSVLPGRPVLLLLCLYSECPLTTGLLCKACTVQGGNEWADKLHCSTHCATLQPPSVCCASGMCD